MENRNGEYVSDFEYVRGELAYRLNRAEFLLSLWENVEIVTKKDGTPYKNVARSIKNAEYVTNAGGHCPEIYVSGINPDTGTLEEDHTVLYYYVDEDYYEDLSPKSSIFTHKMNLELEIRKYEQQLERCEEIYCGFFEDVDKLFGRLYERCVGLHIDGGSCDLERLLVDVILERKYFLLKDEYRSIYND